MALVIFGGGVTAIKGSIGGTTFSSGKGGSTAKKKSVHLLNNSAQRKFFQQITTYLSKEWTYDLTTAQRAAWTAIAKSTPYVTGSGRVSHHSGQTVFILSNFWLIWGGFPENLAPPTTQAVGTITAIAISAKSASGGTALDLTNTVIDATANDYVIWQYSKPLNQGQGSALSSLRYAATPAVINGTDSRLVQYEGSFGSIPSAGGQKIMVQGRVLNSVTGITSAPLLTSSTWV